MRIQKFAIATVVALAGVLGNIAPAHASDLEYCADGSTYTVSELADGGTLKTKNLDAGQLQVASPPAAFDPETASADQLETYAIPPKPADSTSEDYSLWLRIATSAAHATVASVCSETVLSAEGYPEVAVPSGNWGGYVAKQSTDSYIGVAAQWVEPSYAAPVTGCSAPQASIWVGVGGYGTQSLLQAGTALDSKGAHIAWYEWLSPSNTVPMQGISEAVIRPGDVIYTYVSASKATNQVTFSVSNLTLGTYYPKRFTMTPLANFLDGTSAEVVVERPTILYPSGAAFAVLADFGTLDFSSAQVQIPDGTYRTLRVTAPTQLTMTNTSGQALELTYSMGSATGFRTVFQKCK